jgi:signal transduction histidine kinase
MTPMRSDDRAAWSRLSWGHEVVASGRWLLRIRWLMGAAVLVATAFASEVAGLGFHTLPVYLTGVAILLYNSGLNLRLRQLEERGHDAAADFQKLAHVQVGLDWLAMLALIHFTGGIESPLIYFFVFHIVTASLMFERSVAAGYACAAWALTASVALTESAGWLPHLHLEGFLVSETFNEPGFVLPTLAAFGVVSVVTFFLTSFITEHVRRREEQLATLYLGATALSSTLDVKEVLEKLAQATAEAMGVQGASISLVDPTRTQLEPAASYGLSETYLAKGPLVLDPAFVQAQALESGEPVFVQSEEAYRRLQYPDAVAAEGIRSILYVRLIGKGNPLGLMRVYSSRPGAFTLDDARFLSAIAAQGATAVDKAMSYQALRQLDADKSKFVRMVTHELRGPVSGAQSLVCLILGGYAGEFGNKQREFLGRLSRRLETLQLLINDLLDLAAGRSGLDTRPDRPLVVADCLRQVLAQHEPLALEKKQHLVLECSHAASMALVLASGEALMRVFGNLVGNAVKYTPNGGNVTVTAELAEAFLVVEVRDTGIGIPDPCLPKLFTEFFRAPNAKAVEVGTGLGLVIVKEVVERFGGTISVSSKEGKGSIFTVHLPVTPA